MTSTPVVTCFLRHRDDVLLLRRSDAVGSYRGLWGAVSGHVASDEGDRVTPDRDPLTASREEIAEETGLLDACNLVRARESFGVDGEDDEIEGESHGTWLVHPFLFECDSQAVVTNEETAEHAWVPPTEILRRETVPGLWTAYDRVRPTVETVREDREHGSAYLSLRALDVLRDRAGELAVAGDLPDEAAYDELATLAADLRDARPGMTAVANRLARAVAEADARTPAAVETSTRAVVERALDADEEAATVAAEHVRGDRVLTLSRSGTVLTALRRADPAAVVVAESRPGREGVEVAETLVAEGLDVTLVPDAAVAHHLGMGEIDAVLVGADTVLADGSVVNKVGTRAAALAASRADVPVYVVAARGKVSPEAEGDVECVDPATVYEGAADLQVETPLFDVTPADLIDAVFTEDGVLSTQDVERVADEHRGLANWQ